MAEVFKNREDAARRAGYMDCFTMFYLAFDWKEDTPRQVCQYKNVVLRVGPKMPYKKAEKTLQGIEKNSEMISNIGAHL